MSALAKSPLADAMREAGLSEKQIKAALEAAEKQPVDLACDHIQKRVHALGLDGVEATIVVERDGKDWVRIVVMDAGVICFWPKETRTNAKDSWHLDAITTNPDAAPSPMARAQRLYDLYRELSK